jgi:hypothetical protein
MATPQGQATWETQGTGSKDFIISFETEKNIAYEMRHQSALGRLSKPVAQKTIGAGPEARDIDVGASACIWSKEVTTGDEVRFTMEQAMRGAPSYGDSPVPVGDYLAYLHANFILNMVKTPAVPIQEEMSLQRVKDVISTPDTQIRNAITMYMAEEYALEAYSGYLRGASPNLLAAKVDGGRALDLGRGAGKQVSPQNFLIAGNGFTSGTAGADAFETQLKTDMGTLTDTTSDYISREFIHNLRYALTQKKIKPVVNDGKPMWYAMVDPDLMARLTAPDGTLYKAWLIAQDRAAKNPVFGHAEIELDGILFFPDPWLKKFRPDVSGSDIVWGQTGDDKRDFEPTSKLALMTIWGEGCLLEGHNGSVRFTTNTGRHGDNKEIAARIKQSFMRARYVPKDGRSGINIEQGSLTCAFYEPGLTF